MILEFFLIHENIGTYATISTKFYILYKTIPPFDKKANEFPKNSLSDSTWTNTLLLFFYTPTPYSTKSLRL